MFGRSVRGAKRLLQPGNRPHLMTPGDAATSRPIVRGRPEASAESNAQPGATPSRKP